MTCLTVICEYDPELPEVLYLGQLVPPHLNGGKQEKG